MSRTYRHSEQLQKHAKRLRRHVKRLEPYRRVKLQHVAPGMQ